MTASEMGKLGAAARIRNTTRQQREAWARKAGLASGRARKSKQRDNKKIKKIQPFN